MKKIAEFLPKAKENDSQLEQALQNQINFHIKLGDLFQYIDGKLVLNMRWLVRKLQGMSPKYEIHMDNPEKFMYPIEFTVEQSDIFI